jgi:hypothetical protein
MKSREQELARRGRDIAQKKHAEKLRKKKPGGGDDEGGEQRELQPGRPKYPKRPGDQR